MWTNFSLDQLPSQLLCSASVLLQHCTLEESMPHQEAIVQWHAFCFRVLIWKAKHTFNYYGSNWVTAMKGIQLRIVSHTLSHTQSALYPDLCLVLLAQLLQAKFTRVCMFILQGSPFWKPFYGFLCSDLGFNCLLYWSFQNH